jgi:hypothetical protein
MIPDSYTPPISTYWLEMGSDHEMLVLLLTGVLLEVCGKEVSLK